MEYNDKSNRIAYVIFRVKEDGSQILTLIQVYAPLRSKAEDRKIEEFYETLGDLIEKREINVKHRIIPGAPKVTPHCQKKKFRNFFFDC